MKKPEGRTIIMIDKLHKPENTIDYAHIEIFENSPLKGLPRK